MNSRYFMVVPDLRNLTIQDNHKLRSLLTGTASARLIQDNHKLQFMVVLNYGVKNAASRVGPCV